MLDAFDVLVALAVLDAGAVLDAFVVLVALAVLDACAVLDALVVLVTLAVLDAGAMLDALDVLVMLAVSDALVVLAPRAGGAAGAAPAGAAAVAGDWLGWFAAFEAEGATPADVASVAGDWLGWSAQSGGGAQGAAVGGLRGVVVVAAGSGGEDPDWGKGEEGELGCLATVLTCEGEEGG